MIRALIVVEVPFYREGLAELLNRSGQVQVAAAVSEPAAAEQLAARERPDVILIDAALACAGPSIQRIRALPSPPKFVAIAVSETPESVLGWAELGVDAYVPRSALAEELVRVLEAVVRSEFQCSPRMAAHLLHHVAALASASRRPDDPFGDLSPREQEVLSLLARGLPNKAIASKLSISHATAKNHVHKVLEKLRLHRRSEVASLIHGAAPRR